ncbi:SDR family oxidoreductase [Spongiibacter sp. KMU-166]|uniref:SDR family oxidoreductase n=1 Tax=Spongiibacter thalassae TaxID=2721624 RepID=A0ABX1GBP5_9GAMM|nr:SDR family oxidoreductase [Spongiibacter thalassae]NKI16351.1 SDR family oxidoreductase [Spongiibacter thalassae]
MDISGKVYVVTGAGSGIGRGLAHELLKRGAEVALVDMNGAALRETLKLFPGEASDRCSLHVVDVTDRQGVAALPEQVIAHHARVDGLINNAGIIQQFHSVSDLSQADIDRVLNVNFLGTVNVTRAFLPALMAREQAYIANVSSMGAFAPVPGQTLYGAAKAAVKMFTEGLRSELADTGVVVSVVFPGAIETGIVKNSGAEKTQPVSSANVSFKMLPAAEAARQIVDGIAKNKYRILVGRDAFMLDLVSRISPAAAARLIIRQLKQLTPASG